MSPDQSIEELRKEVRYVRDRLDIQDCLMRHCRGVDRHDAELMASCYHADAVIKHANRDQLIAGSEYGEWSNAAHAGGRFALHSHQITNINCELDGDVAYCESYVLTLFLSADEQTTAIVAGRYLDRFERRDGVWKIAVRRAFLDLAGDAPATYMGNARAQPIDPTQFWTRADLSYQRPYDLDAPAPQWT
jgi:ketosteroid isomerase-like protein